jgi:hypothetical protein
VKPAGISGRKEEYLKDKIKEFAMNSRDKDIRELYREINKFKEA